ncbi:MAG: methyltransferase domain-containing protein [Acidimicrobiales bacterium]
MRGSEPGPGASSSSILRPAAIAQARQHAELLLRAGAAATDVLGVLLAAVREHGEDARLLSDVAAVLYACDLVDEAKAMIERAAVLDPDDLDVAANRLSLTDPTPVVASPTDPQDGQLRLNVGAGDDRRPGYLSIDLRTEVSDVVASVEALPFPDRCVAEVLAMDILEHVPVFRTQELLAEWHRVLLPDGVLRCRVPNLDALASLLLGGHDVAEVIENVYGGHRWGPDGAFDAHHHGFTPATFQESLALAGFVVVDLDHEPNMTATAVRP